MNELAYPSDRRSFLRVAFPFEAAVNGVSGRFVDMSLGGFRAAGLDLAVGEVADVQFRINHGGLSVEVQVTARCVSQEGGECGFAFLNLGPQQAYVLDALCAATTENLGVEPGDAFLKYATRRAERAVSARYALAPLAI